jgi:alpha-galactosidase
VAAAVAVVVVLILFCASSSGRPVLVPAVEKADLASTPPMGWSSWNTFGCNINEEIVRKTTDALVSSGMKAAGYRYVNVDDCWMAPDRAHDGRLIPEWHQSTG